MEGEGVSSRTGMDQFDLHVGIGVGWHWVVCIGREGNGKCVYVCDEIPAPWRNETKALLVRQYRNRIVSGIYMEVYEHEITWVSV